MEISVADPGYDGFLRYYHHATVFREAARIHSAASGGLAPLMMCSTAHPGRPEEILDRVGDRLKSYVHTELNGDLLGGLKATLHQSLELRSAIASGLQRRTPLQMRPEDFLVLPGSSTQWL